MKKILCLILLFVLSGCSKEPTKYDQQFQLYFYYIEGCSLCDAFKEEGIPLIEDEFGSAITITSYDLDDSDTKTHYDQILSQLDVEQFDTDYYGIAPFIVFDEYFAKLGVFPGEYELFVEDMIAAINDEELSEDLSMDRVPFIK